MGLGELGEHRVELVRRQRGRRVRVEQRRSTYELGVGGHCGIDGQTDDVEEAPVERRTHLREVADGPPKPDMYVYDFDLCGSCATVPEHRLTDDLRRVAELVLAPRSG